ncbi:hypothetical protein BU16DRAFT_619053 [Lophium mytilinum]|uniref:Cytochrome P450 n=1 Tax=Lophium mytilinum TaxID=390894 RepID=A0A6A6QNL4_9PEZI|nr:hypothetical protein BU16DRAFT_619053 [Lophium mytilinum]
MMLDLFPTLVGIADSKTGNIAAAVVFVIVTLVYVRSGHYELSDCPGVSKTFTDEVNCRRVLQAKTTNDEHKDLRIALTSRAVPNQRLTVAFGIDNAFTTTSIEKRKSFKDQSISILHRPSLNSGWEKLHFGLRIMIRDALIDKSILLVPLVQSLTLRITLGVLFDLDPVQIPIGVAEELASDINDIWLASKCGSIPIWRTQTRTHMLLRTLISSRNPLDAAENPMNFILPAYETLWRVVLRCFIEIAYRGPRANRTIWRQAIHESLSTNKDESIALAKVSADNIAREALRLYPPTRRVYRYESNLNTGLPEVVAADIEACQRNETEWGADAKTFNPDRWTTIDDPAKRLLAFGDSPFRCPAYNDFGFRMIILLTGALSEGVGEDWELQSDSGDELPEWGTPLCSARKAYSQVRLQDMRSCN